MKTEVSSIDFAMKDRNEYRRIVFGNMDALRIHEKTCQLRGRQGIITNDEIGISDRQWAEMSEPEKDHQRRIFWDGLVQKAIRETKK